MILSYSSISTYQNCPLSYKFAYLDKLPRKKSPALSFGSTIHKALYYFYNVPTPNPPSLEELLSFMHKNWLSRGYLNKSEESAYKEHAEHILTNFYRSNIDSFSLPVAIEYRFQIKLDEKLSSGETCLLSGVIDKVERTPDGKLEIVDYKTGKKLPSQSNVNNDLQLSMYYFAVKETWQIEPEKLTLYFVVPNMKISTIRKPEDIQKIKNLILKVAENINKGNFKPTENALCPWCDFQIYCPIFKYKFKNTNEAIEAKKVIDEYAMLRQKEKLLKERLGELQFLINQYFDENNCNKIYSETNEITRSERLVYDYDANKLKEIMEPLGLWEKILKIDSKRLDDLLKSDRLNEKIKELIETTKEIKSVSHNLYLKKIN
ncbi:PD-(D/E)XK nuclease family protein [Candidatus Oleimmundimicrobium sp.]|uniref:RecB family exonuclease n=1 Tax=Candidatus Oleimmundimicrobium sp. TaxID=3060597 RepID=UPI00271A93E6|nr:PD-(D/E)XK nuclease family protein [Candidatus Oleimmundimicrobium sp.]MDO8886480.1 PD-(D/E)XK nuclease family protein [Candidatus Oleimmundimicrobium sp.]